MIGRPGYDGNTYPSDGYSVRCIRDTLDGWVEGEQVMDYDGNVYDTIRITSGPIDLVILKQNLAVSHFKDGVSIPIYETVDGFGVQASSACRAYNNDWNNVFIS